MYTIADYSRQSLCEVEIVVRGPNHNEQGCIYTPSVTFTSCPTDEQLANHAQLVV